MSRARDRADGDYKTDSSVIDFGADGDVTLTHDPDDGLILKSKATADDNPILLTLQTGETDLAADDVIGKIAFQAPDEGTGTDAILVSAAIQAVAEGNHSSSSNATSLKFTTASSAATAVGGTDGGEMTLLSNGALLLRDKRTTGAPTLALQAGRTDVSDGDILGGIEFSAPVEASGTDAILVGASVQAICDADFSSSSNATALVFKTGASETAAEKMRINSSGFVKSGGGYGSLDSDGTWHEFNTSQQTTTGIVNVNSNASRDGIGVLVYHTVSHSNTNAKFYGAYSNYPGGSADLEFYVRADGQVYADQSFNASGADYAELFEWKDGNSSSEDRVGYSVVLDGNQIRKATSDDSASSIIGVISGNPSVVGDADGENWNGQYLKDDYNRYTYKDSELYQWTEKVDEAEQQITYYKDSLPDDVTVPSDATTTKVKVRNLNPDYDVSKKDSYERREDRKEWSYVGMMGKLRMLKGQPTGDRWIKMRDISDTVEEWLVR